MPFNNEVLEHTVQEYESQAINLSDVRPQVIGTRRIHNLRVEMVTYELSNGFWPYQVDFANFDASTETLAHMLAQDLSMLDCLYDLCLHTDWLASNISPAPGVNGFLSFLGGASAKLYVGGKNILDAFYFSHILNNEEFRRICDHHHLHDDQIRDMAIIVSAVHIEFLSKYGIFCFSRPYVSYEARTSFIPTEERLRELANIRRIEDVLRSCLVPLPAPRDTKYVWLPDVARHLQISMHNLGLAVDKMRIEVRDVDVLRYCAYVLAFFEHDHPDYVLVSSIPVVQKTCSNLTLLRAFAHAQTPGNNNVTVPARPVYAAHQWADMCVAAYDAIIGHPSLKTDTLIAMRQFFSYEKIMSALGRPACVLAVLNSRPVGKVQALHRLPDIGNTGARNIDGDQMVRYTELIELSAEISEMQKTIVTEMNEQNMLAMAHVAYSGMYDPEDTDMGAMTFGMNDQLTILFGAAFADEVWLTATQVVDGVYELFLTFVKANMRVAPKELVMLQGITQKDGYLLCHHPLLIPFCMPEDDFYGSNEVPALTQTFNDPTKYYFSNDHDDLMDPHYRRTETYNTLFEDGSDATIRISHDMLYGTRYSQGFRIGIVIPIFDTIAAQKVFSSFIHLANAIEEWPTSDHDGESRTLVSMHRLIAQFDTFLRPARSSSVIMSQTASISRELALIAVRDRVNVTLPLHARLNELSERIQHARMTTWLVLFHAMKGCLLTPQQMRAIMTIIDENHGWLVLADLTDPKVGYIK